MPISDLPKNHSNLYWLLKKDIIKPKKKYVPIQDRIQDPDFTFNSDEELCEDLENSQTPVLSPSQLSRDWLGRPINDPGAQTNQVIQGAQNYFS
jgi:hypothetical protein